MSSNHPAASRGSSGTRRTRAAYRNEVKTRLTDLQYHALQRFRVLHGIDSDSSALPRAASIALLGMVGILPAEISGITDESGHFGPQP